MLGQQAFRRKQVRNIGVKRIGTLVLRGWELRYNY